MKQIMLKRKNILKLIFLLILFALYLNFKGSKNLIWGKGEYNLGVTGRRMEYIKHEIVDGPTVAMQLPHEAKLFLEPEVTADFPSLEDGPPKIQHIIHQTYKDVNVPTKYVPFIKSFVNKNPDWVYYFWTDTSANQLIVDEYPVFLKTWNNYTHYMNRADAMRYFILHQYGGIYADLDVECLRPLDRVTSKFSCIFPPEPFQNSAFGFPKGKPYVINNAIMLCSRGHPFLAMMLEKLEEHAFRIGILGVAGPIFVTRIFDEYIQKMLDKHKDTKSSLYIHGRSEPFFYQNLSLPHETDDDIVYVPNTHFFMNTASPIHKTDDQRALCGFWNQGLEIMRCDVDKNIPGCEIWMKPLNRTDCGTYHDRNKMPVYCRDLDDIRKRACHELARNDKKSGPLFTYTFTKHHWAGGYNVPKDDIDVKVNIEQKIGIIDVVPYVKYYARKINTQDPTASL